MLGIAKSSLTAFLDRLLERQSYKPILISKADFDSEYAEGRWKQLEEISELAHYSIIAGYSSFYHASPAILDVGCGHGLLQMKLAGKYEHYTGIDSSSVAIGQTARLNDARTRFFVADALAYVPDRSFDQVIFNEILYYVSDPVELIAHYVPFLSPNGRVIISMYKADRPRIIWPMIERKYFCEDAVGVRHAGSGVEWTIKTFRISLQS